ncbi:MAG: ABC transporter permease [Chthonomonadales bacterium]
MRAYISLTTSGLKSFVRDRGGLFWTFFFPLFFIFIFGSIFSKQGDKDTNFKVAIRIVMLENSPATSWVPDVFQNNPVLESTLTDMETARKDLSAGKARAIVVFPKDFSLNLLEKKPSEVTIITDPAATQMGMTAGTIVRTMLTGIEKKSANTPDLFNVQNEVLQQTSKRNKQKQNEGINFLLPGILAMTIMQLGLFTAIPIINMREKGILKRLQATPLPRGTLVASQVTQRLVIGVVQTLTIVTIGVAFFHFEMVGSWPILLLLVVFGVVTFISLGAVLSSIAKTQETGISLVQLVNFPMMFLSGLFFPVEILPPFMKPIVSVMPATYLADLLRHVMSGAELAHSLPTDIGILGAWLVGCMFIATRIFRWE